MQEENILTPWDFQIFLLVICNPKYSARSPTTLSENICLAVQKSYLATKDLTTIINDIPKEYANETIRRRVILRNYLNLIILVLRWKMESKLGKIWWMCIETRKVS